MSAIINQNENVNENLSSPTVDEWDAIYEYMIVNNLSSYSNRDDCVDDDYCVDDEPSSTYVRCLSAFEESQEQEQEQEQDQDEDPIQEPEEYQEPVQQPEEDQEEQDLAVQAIYDRIAREAAEFIDRLDTGSLTEKDKEWIWNYGTEEEKEQLGDWQPPEKTLLNLSERAKRGLQGYMNLEKEIKERKLRFERGEETPLDIIWYNEMGISKL